MTTNEEDVPIEHEAEESDDGNPLAKMSYEERLQFASVIAKPMASEKLTKRLGKLMNKAKRNKSLACGVKDCIKQITKKKSPGIMVIAGDVSPIDTVSHIPVVCENHNILYCFVPSRYDLGCTISSNLNGVCVFIKEGAEYQGLYDKCKQSLDKLSQSGF